jgi:hypothetical protein
MDELRACKIVFKDGTNTWLEESGYHDIAKAFLEYHNSGGPRAYGFIGLFGNKHVIDLESVDCIMCWDEDSYRAFHDWFNRVEKLDKELEPKEWEL